jgi:large subunit ribosomal protein L1
MAKRHSRRFLDVLKKVTRAKLWTVHEAIDTLKQISSAKFDETLEISIRLGVDPRKAEENIRGTVVLPNGLGKAVNVAVIAKGEAAMEAEKAGADRVGGEDLVDEIAAGWSDFDVLVAHVEMMKVVGRLGRTLGPRMPNKKSGTATEDVGDAVRQLKAGKVEYRVDRQSNVSVPLGKLSFESQKLCENFQVLMGAVLAAKPSGLKGIYLRQVYLSSSMGPGLRIDVANVRDVAGEKTLAA